MSVWQSLQRGRRARWPLFGRIDRNALAGAGLHSRLAMAGETTPVFTIYRRLYLRRARPTPEGKAKSKPGKIKQYDREHLLKSFCASNANKLYW